LESSDATWCTASTGASTSERPPIDSTGHVLVDGLAVREPVAVVEVLGQRDRLRDQAVDRGRPEAQAHERRRGAAEHPVEGRAQSAAGERRQAPDRGHHADLGEVERTRHQRHRAHRELARGGCEQRHDAAQAPADDLDLVAARVADDRVDRVRDDLVDPMLEPERAVAERDRAVIDDVGRVATRQQVLGKAAAVAQVEAPRGRGKRRDEQDRRDVRGLSAAAQVAVDGPLGTLVDDRLARRMHLGDAAAEVHVPRVRGRIDHVVQSHHHAT
jgi:hypothetical protein